MSKVLLALTSYYDTFYDDGAKTGLFITEAVHPFQYFRSQGIEVDIVSETGTFGYDEHSLLPDFLQGEDLKIYEDPKSEYNLAIKAIKKASDVNASDYNIFYAAGGHGTLMDFPHAKDLHAIAQKIWANNGVVSAVCHGPVIFDNLTDLATGKPLVEGKKVTGFTDEGEVLMGVDAKLKRDNLETVREIVEKLGGSYVLPTDPWGDFSIADGKLVSGANPASAHSTAVKALAASK